MLLCLNCDMRNIPSAKKSIRRKPCGACETTTTDNPFIESFNRGFRDERLNVEVP
jgi:hypothetical protein